MPSDVGNGPLSPEHLRQLAAETLLAHYAEFCEGAVIVDREARIVWMNERYPARLGLTMPADADIVGRPIEEVIPHSLMRQVVERGQPILLDVMEHRTGAFVVSRLPLRNAAGEVVGAVGFMLLDDPEALGPLLARHQRLRRELAEAERKLAAARSTKYTFASIIGDGPATSALKQAARRAARSAAPVLITGETGVGKEMLAQAIHAAGPRFNAPFVAVNLAAIPDNLLEAEFFGVAPGAFTGAERRGREGKFKLADGGTLFLDEIGDLPLVLQAKLLRVVQEQEVEALGSNRLQKIDVRIIAATSRDLAAMVAAGQFRADLYYRLNVIALHAPPLRERREDLPRLAEDLVDRICRRQGLPTRAVGETALRRLAAHDWPGNVRELANVLERALLMSDSDPLEAGDLDAALPHAAAAWPAASQAACPPAASFAPPGGGMAQAVAQAERAAICRALREHRGNKTQAARSLGISRAALYEKMALLAVMPADVQ